MPRIGWMMMIKNVLRPTTKLEKEFVTNIRRKKIDAIILSKNDIPLKLFNEYVTQPAFKLMR